MKVARARSGGRNGLTVRARRRQAQPGSSMSAELPALEATVAGETVTVVLRGELDVASEGFLSAWLERIRQSGPRRIVFDVSQVGFMDCASARLIAGTGNWLPAGVRPVIRGPSPLVRRTLEASGIGRSCQLEPSVPPDG